MKKLFGLDMKPTVLIADGSDAITNGFKNVFGSEFIRLLCYFHLTKNVKNKLKGLEAKQQTEIVNDISDLQLSPSKEVFDRASILFLEKWNSKSDPLITSFMEYFKLEWFVRHRLWYEGASPGNPSTNNSLEATNSTIKKQFTIRERVPVSQFIGIVMDKILPSWSKDRNPAQVNTKLVATTPSIKLELWTKAYQWAT